MNSKRNRLFDSVPWLLLYAGGALGVGFAVPVLIESTDGGRLGQRYQFLLNLTTGIWIGSACLALVVASSRRRFWPAVATDEDSLAIQQASTPKQVTLRHLLIGITLLCLLLISARWLGPVGSWWLVWITIGLALAYAFYQGADAGIRLLALLAGLYFPFAWFFAFNVPWGHSSGLVEELPRAPGIIPAALLRGLGADIDGQSRATVAAVFAALLIASGTLATRCRGAIAVIAMFVALTVATLGSLALHAAYRA